MGVTSDTKNHHQNGVAKLDLYFFLKQPKHFQTTVHKTKKDRDNWETETNDMSSMIAPA